MAKVDKAGVDMTRVDMAPVDMAGGSTDRMTPTPR